MALADRVQHRQRRRLGANTLARLVDLLCRLKQPRWHLPFGEAAVEIKEGTVPGAATVAVAMGLAALEEAFDQRGVQQVRRELKGAQELGFALAQGQRGSAFERLYPTHIYM